MKYNLLLFIKHHAGFLSRGHQIDLIFSTDFLFIESFTDVLAEARIMQLCSNSTNFHLPLNLVIVETDLVVNDG